MLYNIQGFDTVEINYLANGNTVKTIWIGTGNAEELKQVVMDMNLGSKTNIYPWKESE